MIERRLVRILVTYSKTHYFVDKGTQRGIAYDFGELFEDELNQKLKLKTLRVHVAFVPVAHDDLIPALVAGRGDLAAANLTITPERLAKVDFTAPTWSHVDEIVVTGPASPPVGSAEELSGREVYLRKSSSFYASVQSLNRRLRAAGRPPVQVREAPEVLSDEDILEMVNAGLVPATVVDNHIGEFWAKVFDKIVLNREARLRTDGQIAVAVRKGSPKLAAELNDFLTRYGEGSKERNILLQKYLKGTKYALAATSPAERKKFEQTIDLFRQYSDQYSLDYLLMMAQAYQESQLDQGAKSSVGAIGIMQIMPATGKDLDVGDIRRLEPNIHGGVKYIRHLVDVYFKDAPMTPVDKELFAFASYNAGPGRIRQLRKVAEKRGLDPNVWFNNVEVVVAEQVGRETVQYVSNIYKYYLAYKMITESRTQAAAAKRRVAGGR
jgi:membrane-bound lytic murein transglycosylase MltF